MRDEEKRRPENRGAHREMVVEMAGGCAKVGFGLAAFVEARTAEAGVCGLVVLWQIEMVVTQGGASKSLVSHAVPMHDRIHQRQRQQKQNEEDSSSPDGAAPASGKISGLVRYRFAHSLARTLRQASPSPKRNALASQRSQRRVCSTRR